MDQRQRGNKLVFSITKTGINDDSSDTCFYLYKQGCKLIAALLYRRNIDLMHGDIIISAFLFDYFKGFVASLFRIAEDQ